ncbi:hypothetical protein [Spirosoma sp. KUDC1026]|uniref:hypothetical protein n=1 Tax=Spirosoma sp. KUDC1026 TaxID=2745947 RepID=UPI00159BC17A|nr:hypothetical protein [Spirosoma sp. KUDC1026]QKZ11323.1 hypothetical protein HU175_01190 [Spirosoma sp. KUDC1026]
MKLSDDHQTLVDFFATTALPTGVQHVNEYSVFLDLPAATRMYLQRLYSDVEASQRSAALALTGIRDWALQQHVDTNPDYADASVSL